MSLLWIAVIVAALAAAAWIARPFLRRAEVELNEADSAISIFRDQSEEVRRDLDAGLINASEFDAAQEEIEARTLAAAKSIGEGISVSRRAPLVAASLGAVVLAAAIGAYGALGSPGSEDQPLAARKQETLKMRAEAGDLNSRLKLLIAETAENPESFQDWWMLARTYAATGDHASATDAYRRAAELSGDRPAVLSAYAESMTLANGNKVPQAALLVFQQVLQRAPDPRARYYVALAKAQTQDFDGALEAWAALYRESGPGAPWLALVRRDIVNMARFLKRDVTAYLPDATPEEIARATGKVEDRAATLARIGELERSVEGDPKDYKGWIELARLNSEVGRAKEAAEALERGRNQFAAAPFVLGLFDEAARSLGLDLVATPAVKGPSDADIAAAASLSKQDQEDMIRGMVAGLAAKLEANPDNPDGWIMLVRSYVVTGEMTKARAAYETAMAHYSDNRTVAARLLAEAGPMLGEAAN